MIDYPKTKNDVRNIIISMSEAMHQPTNGPKPKPAATVRAPEDLTNVPAKVVISKIDSIVSREEFFNLVQIIDPKMTDLWTTLFDKYGEFLEDKKNS